MVNTTSFLTTIRTAVQTATIAAGTHLAVGDDNTTPTVADTTLGNEENRKARQEYTSGTSNVIISLFLGTADSNGDNLAEVGVFDAGAAGNMMMRSVFTTIAKTASKDVWIDVEEQITVSQ